MLLFYPDMIFPNRRANFSIARSYGKEFGALNFVRSDELGNRFALLEDWRMTSAAIFLYYPGRRQVPAPLQAFVAFLRENLRAR